MNLPLLRKIKRHILAEPKRIDMHDWLYRKSRRDGGPSCGTVGCIAGWAVLLNAKGKTMSRYEALKLKKRHEWDFAFFALRSHPRRVLGLTNAQANRLFHVANWPARFANAYCNADRPEGRAKATCARIRHFIRTKGRQ